MSTGNGSVCILHCQHLCMCRKRICHVWWHWLLGVFPSVCFCCEEMAISVPWRCWVARWLLYLGEVDTGWLLNAMYSDLDTHWDTNVLLPLLLRLWKGFMPVAGKFHLLSLSRCMVHIRKAITRRKPGHGCSNSLALGHGGPMGEVQKYLIAYVDLQSVSSVMLNSKCIFLLPWKMSLSAVRSRISPYLPANRGSVQLCGPTAARRGPVKLQHLQVADVARCKVSFWAWTALKHRKQKGQKGAVKGELPPGSTRLYFHHSYSKVV